MRAEYPTAHSSKLICASRSRQLFLHGWVRCDSPHQQGVGPQIISMGCTPNIALIDRVLTLPPRYPCRLNPLPASRFLPPRSGLERSDFVPWHIATYCTAIRLRSQTGNTGHGWTCGLPGPIAIDTREPPVGALKKGLLRPRLSAIIMSSRLPASHPDRRAVLIQIVAL